MGYYTGPGCAIHNATSRLKKCHNSKPERLFEHFRRSSTSCARICPLVVPAPTHLSFTYPISLSHFTHPFIPSCSMERANGVFRFLLICERTFGLVSSVLQIFSAYLYFIRMTKSTVLKIFIEFSDIF